MKYQGKVKGFYTGNWKNDKRNGKGKFLWKNDVLFEGSWKNGKRSGRGTLKYPNGDNLSGIGSRIKETEKVL